jgi:hypothetical protein
MNLSDVRFKEVLVAAGCSARLKLTDLPVGATPVWFEVPDEVADDFAVADVWVGLDSQLVSTGSVPASLFARGAPRDELLMDSIATSHNYLSTDVAHLSIDVTNLSSKSLPFTCRATFSDDSARLARYRRARLAGLGVSRVSPLGSLVVAVQPMVPMAPDRLFVPRRVLEHVDVEGLDVCSWSDWRSSVGRYGVVDSVPSECLRRSSLEEDGVFHLGRLRRVGPGECFIARFKNRTNAFVNVCGAILGGVPLP